MQEEEHEQEEEEEPEGPAAGEDMDEDHAGTHMMTGHHW